MVAFLAVGFVACNKETTEETTTEAATTTEAPTTTQEPATTTEESENTLPVLAGVDDVTVALDLEGTFDPTDGVTASDAEDGNLTASIVVTGTVDLSTSGEYTVTYTVTDSDGGQATADRIVTVTLQSFANGFYNYKFASTELRHTFMAAAEDYLLHNSFGGIPLFDSGSYVIYSPRVTLPVSSYIPVMGYAAWYGTMTADDSTVIMDDGALGDAGFYTYRTTISTNPGTFNQWLYDTSTDSTLMGYYFDAPYVYHFNDDKTGYELVPSMADSAPVPIDGHTTDSGKVVSDTWQFSLRDDLEWFFHPDTNATFLASLTAADYVIDANDFVETYKLALEENWFRAISGGGDFVTSSQAIVGAGDFADGAGAWENVGIKVIDDLTVEFTFVDEQSEWNVTYWLGSFVMTPVNLELYDYLENDGNENTTYGISEDTTGYTGPYYVDYYESDVELIFLENTSYHDPSEYFYDSFLFYVEDDPDVIWLDFTEGKLDVAAIPTAQYDTYKDYPGVMPVPGATIYRMMINGLGTVEAQQELFPDSTWTPEPILANQDFKNAMFFAIDREYLATEVMKTRQPSIFLFSSAYLVDPEMGVAYRDTEAGLTVGTDLAPDTFGFNFDAAQAYYELALEALVAAGTYTAGTAANPTIITLEFNVFAGSESQAAMGDYIEQAFEAAFQSTEYYINIDLEWYPKDFPSIYYDYMMTGDFDLSIGGISGSTLDAASFLDVFCSDNRSGFTLNWGIDTSVAEIPMYYTDDQGVEHAEYWSYDGICSALNGEIFLISGEEAIVPAPQVTDITSTTVTFDITEYENQAYDNITYTVLIYNDAAGTYDELAGYIDIATTSSTVTVEGLTPYYYWYTIDDVILYQSGDYIIQVNFDYKEFEGKSGSSQCSWFPMETIFPDSVTNGYIEPTVATPTSVELGIDVDPAYTGTVASVTLTDYTWTEVTTATIDYSNLDAVTISGLEQGSRYILWVTFDDGLVDAVRFWTADALTAEVTATETGATLVVTINGDDGVTRTITGAVVYLSEDDSAVAGAAVDYNDLNAVAVTGLAAGTDYYVEFTLDDGSVVYIDVTTEAAAE